MGSTVITELPRKLFSLFMTSAAFVMGAWFTTQWILPFVPMGRTDAP